MGRLRRLCAIPLGALVLSAVLAGHAFAAELPEVTREERELKSVPGQPNASAVVLFKKGHFSVTGITAGATLLSYRVQVRRKILTEEGRKYGEISLVHGEFSKLDRFQGRTVLADGRVIPLPRDAKFKRLASKSEKIFVTSVAFPAVEVGAILDYSYELHLDSLLSVEPWYFQEEIPTLFSEILYKIPRIVGVNSWIQDPMRTGISREVKETFEGWEILGQGKNLPAIPAEPYGLPRNDVAGYMRILPAFTKGVFGQGTLLKTWTSTCELFAPSYEAALRGSRTASRKAKAIVAKLPGAGSRERAEAIYRFVRDEIETTSSPGVGLPAGSTADAVLKASHGDFAEKALLLQAMLQAVDVPGQPVWVAERNDGKIDMSYPNPGSFDRVILAADVEGRRLFLDPSDRSLAFARLAPGLDGMPALLFSAKNPETITLPVPPFEENLRQAKVELDLDGQGRLAGRGTLALGGHHAWTRLHWRGDAEATAKAWQEWLAEAFQGFEVSGVKVVEAVEEQKVSVTWAMVQREEEVLGDEVTLLPSRPLGPTTQPFQLPAAQRVSGILFDFADRDEVELTLRWPEGWKLETLPPDTQTPGPAGSLTASFEVDEPGRQLTYRRRFDIKERELGKDRYNAVRALFTQTEKHDAQPVVLVRR